MTSHHSASVASGTLLLRFPMCQHIVSLFTMFAAIISWLGFTTAVRFTLVIPGLTNTETVVHRYTTRICFQRQLILLAIFFVPHISLPTEMFTALILIQKKSAHNRFEIVLSRSTNSERK